MGRYGDPVTWLEAGDEQSDVEPEDALDVVGDAEPVGQLPQIEYEDISDAEDTPAQAHVEYENIPDAEQAPDVQVDGVIFEFHDDWPCDTFVEGQSTTYLVHRPGIEPGPPAWQASILPLTGAYEDMCLLLLAWQL